MNNNCCIECGKSISRVSLRCKSCAQKGTLNHFYGKKHSSTTKEIISKHSKGKWKGYSNPRVSDPLLGDRNPNWKGGTSYNSVYPYVFKKKMRPLILSIYKCCQWCESNKNLVVHHIDHNIRNNDFCNLITLCHTCNIQEMYDLQLTKYYYFRTLTENKFQQLYLHGCDLPIINDYPGKNPNIYTILLHKEKDPIANRGVEWGVIKTR